MFNVKLKHQKQQSLFTSNNRRENRCQSKTIHDYCKERYSGDINVEDIQIWGKVADKINVKDRLYSCWRMATLKVNNAPDIIIDGFVKGICAAII